jgi:hypothetical protein
MSIHLTIHLGVVDWPPLRHLPRPTLHTCPPPAPPSFNSEFPRAEHYHPVKLPGFLLRLVIGRWNTDHRNLL